MPAWKRKRIREIRRKMAIGGGACALLLLVIIIATVSGNKKNPKEQVVSRDTVISAISENAQKETAEADQQAAQETQNTQDTATADSGAALTPDPAGESGQTESLQEEQPEQQPIEPVETSNTGAVLYNPAADRVTDRSNFAAQPGIPCGQDHNNGEKVVYLTLDDGPSYLTEQFLDVLDRYGVKCTFFVTGQDPDYYYLIAEAYNRGHTIGLHTYSHNYEYIYSSPENYFNDLYTIAGIVEQQIGYVPCFIRFPGGADNWISTEYCDGIMSYLSQEVQNRGFQYFDWNISSGDGSEGVDVDTLVANATNNYDWPNLVLLSHDGPYKESTLEALPRIIEYYLSQGYEFRPLDRDTFFSHAAVRN